MVELWLEWCTESSLELLAGLVCSATIQWLQCQQTTAGVRCTTLFILALVSFWTWNWRLTWCFSKVPFEVGIKIRETLRCRRPSIVCTNMTGLLIVYITHTVTMRSMVAWLKRVQLCWPGRLTNCDGFVHDTWAFVKRRDQLWLLIMCSNKCFQKAPVGVFVSLIYGHGGFSSYS